MDQELALPHSPRTVIIPSGSGVPDTVHMLYSPTTSAILRIDTSSNPPLSVTDLPNTPLPPPSGAQAREPVASSSTAPAEVAASTSTTGGLGGAFSGLGGYVGLGGKAAVPVGTRTFGGEVLLGRQGEFWRLPGSYVFSFPDDPDQGGFFSSEGNFTRQESIQWSAPPEAIGEHTRIPLGSRSSTNVIAFSSPFIYSVVPSAPSPTNATPSPSVNIHLGPTLLSRRPLEIPRPSAGSCVITSLVPVDPPTGTSPAEALSASTRVLSISTPTDKTLLQSEGSTIYALRSGDVGEEVDELVKEGHTADAIGLVESVGEGGLAPVSLTSELFNGGIADDQSRRLAQLKPLNAVCQFAKGLYQPAMDTFLVFNVNPALVISLFPADTISGPLHVSRDGWMKLFGAVDGARLEPVSAPSRAGTGDDSKSVLRMPHLGLNKKSSVDTLKQDTASVSSDGDKPAPAMTGEEREQTFSSACSGQGHADVV